MVEGQSFLRPVFCFFSSFDSTLILLPPKQTLRPLELDLGIQTLSEPVATSEATAEAAAVVTAEVTAEGNCQCRCGQLIVAMSPCVASEKGRTKKGTR